MPVPDSYKPSDTKPESKHLRAEDYDLDTMWKLVIRDVNLETMPARDDKPARKRLILSFTGREKSLVLNATNQGFLELRHGHDPNRWPGIEIVLQVTTVQFGHDTVKAFRIIQAKKAEDRALDEIVPPDVAQHLRERDRARGREPGEDDR